MDASDSAVASYWISAGTVATPTIAARGRNLHSRLRSSRSRAPRPARRFGSRSMVANRRRALPYHFPFLIEASRDAESPRI